jgi:hypothetical protein
MLVNYLSHRTILFYSLSTLSIFKKTLKQPSQYEYIEDGLPN